jgi:hypothetical protein
MTVRQRMAAMAVLMVSITVAAGCGEQPMTVQEPSPWDPIARTLKPGLDAASPNVCNRGDDECIDAVVAEMTRRFTRLARTCAHDAVFALMYLRVTEAVREETSGQSASDPRYLRHLDAVFAQLYFDAFDEWTEDRASAPRAWQIAFEAADRHRVSGFGNLLLGMNAHISRDLPFAVASIGLVAGPQGTSARRSFDDVNAILGDVQRPIMREAADRFDPTIAGADLRGLFGEDSVAGLLSTWRDEAMRNGERLLAATSDAQRGEVARSIEDAAAGRAALIVAATSRIPFSEAGKARERQCSAASANA